LLAGIGSIDRAQNLSYMLVCGECLTVSKVGCDGNAERTYNDAEVEERLEGAAFGI
jgi:hypothetical protein